MLKTSKKLEKSTEKKLLHFDSLHSEKHFGSFFEGGEGHFGRVGGVEDTIYAARRGRIFMNTCSGDLS